MNYPLFRADAPSEATLVCEILASFSRLMACDSLLQVPQLGDPIGNQTARREATLNMIQLFVRLSLSS